MPHTQNSGQALSPVYRRVIETRHLEGSPQEKADLGFLMAFQLLRAKATRHRFETLENVVETKMKSLGMKVEDIEGWEPQTEETRKRFNLVHLREMLPKFGNIIAHKEFRLAEAMPGRSFYLGDNPVCLHNAKSFGPYGNLGLAVPGIEIYLPLSSTLILCAWCPSIVAEISLSTQRELEAHQQHLLSLHLAGRIPAGEMKVSMAALQPAKEQVDMLSDTLISGTPMTSTAETMDFYNSLQCGEAFRYVVCQKADFALAKRHNNEFPELRKGRIFSV